VKLLLNIHHTPWECMFADVFHDAEIHVLDWNTIFRSAPRNVRVVSVEESKDSKYDAIIQDNDSVSIYRGNENTKKVYVLHCEQDMNSQANRERCFRVYDENDFVVSITPHKLWTLRGLATNPKSRMIRHAVYPSYPNKSGEVKVVGTAHNSMNGEHLCVWNAVASRFDSSIAIGHNNESALGIKKNPHGTVEYLRCLSGVDVFVNIVGGDAFGMSPMEAMALGIPVVTGLNQDLPEQFVSGWNCLISGKRSHHDPSEMVHMVNMLINDPELARRIGKSGRETVSQVFSPEVFRKKWQEIT